jgi:hypothetical protein
MPLPCHQCCRLDGLPSSCTRSVFCLVGEDAAGLRGTARGVAGNTLRAVSLAWASSHGPTDAAAGRNAVSSELPHDDRMQDLLVFRFLSQIFTDRLSVY